MKIDKTLLLISFLIISLPILVGLIYWNQLPDTIATHFNTSGKADGYSSKVFTVFGLPLLLMLLHTLCLFVTTKSPKTDNIGYKIMYLIYWLIPIASVFVMIIIYLPALNISINQNFFGGIFLAGLLVVIGNYLPKMRQNYTIGIRLPWTLADEDNWNRTHRLAGKVWVLAGFVALLDTFLQIAVSFVFTSVMAVIILVPLVYSFWYSQRKK